MPAANDANNATMLIPFTQPMDLTATIESGQAFRWRREDLSQPGQGQWYFGVIFNNVVKMRHSSKGIEFCCAPDQESTLEPLLRDYLRLDDDLEAIYSSIMKDDRINASVARYPGMRLVRQEPWECLISFICSSNSNIPRISANIEDISRSFGRPVRMGDHLSSTFPTPQALAEAGEARLRQLGLGFRATYVAAVATIIADGDLDLFGLREATYEDALEALTALPGVADKIANCVLLFSLDKLEAFPVDVWVHRAIEEWYLDGTDKKLSRKDMRPWAQDYFGRYAGYANQYLFHNRRLQGKA